MPDVGHNFLQDELAAQLRAKTDRMVWTNIALGTVHSPRPDVFTLAKSYDLDARVYEVKASRADAMADIKSGKWQAYLQFCRGVYFAAPVGILKPADIPAEAGLYLRQPDGAWRAARKPTLQRQPTLPPDTWMKLLMDGIEREARRPDLHERDVARHRAQAAVRRRYGDTLANLLAQRDHGDTMLRTAITVNAAQRETLQSELAMVRASIDGARHEIAGMWADFAVQIGLPRTATRYAIGSRLREMAARLSEHGEINVLRRQLADIRYAVAAAAPQAMPTIQVDDHG